MEKVVLSPRQELILAKVVDGYLQSGQPVASRSLELLRLLRAAVPAELCIISVGGVETAADVRARLDAGATLVQGYTAFLYEGPFWARSVNRGLARLSAGTARA